MQMAINHGHAICTLPRKPSSTILTAIGQLFWSLLPYGNELTHTQNKSPLADLLQVLYTLLPPSIALFVCLFLRRHSSLDIVTILPQRKIISSSAATLSSPHSFKLQASPERQPTLPLLALREATSFYLIEASTQDIFLTSPTYTSIACLLWQRRLIPTLGTRYDANSSRL